MTTGPGAFLHQHAPWLLAPELGVCVVGTAALAEACRRASVLPSPAVGDLDLAWAPDLEAGTRLLEAKGIYRQTTQANRARGTLALKLDGQRIEITSFRGEAKKNQEKRDCPLAERIEIDLHRRDMTLGALAWWLSEDRILDPLDGLRHWQERRIVAVGNAEDRILDHPVRWLRYYRRAQQWSFELDANIRNVRLDPGILTTVPAEAMATEFKEALLRCPSPGRFFVELNEVKLLDRLAPELALQLDGRPAGPVRHHPEISQALHLTLALEWVHEHCQHLSERERTAVALAVLCHDFGKGSTEAELFPAHHGHENSGIEPIRCFFSRFPGLADATTRRLAEAVCALHSTARGLDKLRPGTKARLYDQYFRQKGFSVDLFALALGADYGGRLGREQEGEEVARKVKADITEITQRCQQVDAAAIRKQHGSDNRRFRSELHAARARALR